MNDDKYLKKTGVATLFGRIKLHEFLALEISRSYLANHTTAKKKLKVI